MVAELSVKNLTLNEAVKGITVSLDQESDIPLIIRLLENPSSPIALPGKISLENHDYIHVILGCGVTLEDEAFVIGFTMGSDVKTNWFHLAIFKIFSRFLYPKKYRFNREHLKVFDLGFAYGRKPGIIKNINQIDFKLYHNKKIGEIKKLFGISLIEDNPLPWQKLQPKRKLTPGRIAQSVPVVLTTIGTSAKSPKLSAKSPGWKTGKKRNKENRYPVIKKIVTRKKKDKKEAA